MSETGLLSLRDYQRAISERLFPSKLKLRSQENFVATSSMKHVGRLSMIRAYANAPFSLEALRPGKWTDDRFIINLHLSGNSSYTHPDGTVYCFPETMIMTNARSSIAAEQLSPAEALIMVVPGSIMRSHLSGLEEMCWVPRSSQVGAGFIMRNLMLNIWDTCDSLNAREQAALQESYINLLKAMFLQEGHRSSTVWSDDAYMFRQLRAEINARLGDPDLTADSLASAIGVSKSKLYAVTSSMGTSVRRTIIDVRLDWVAEALRNPSLSDMNITKLAMEAGFTSVAHFSRRFKDKFGLTPTEYRQSSGRQD